MNPPAGTTTYVLCPSGAATAKDCTGRSVTLPNLDSGLLTDGKITPNLGQINSLITPGINHYNALFAQLQRRLRHGIAIESAYTFSKNIMSYGVDFNNQFDFRNTHAPYLLDQRHRLTVAAVFQPTFWTSVDSKLLRRAAANWNISTVMQFASGRPYAALLSTDGLPNPINNTASLQATANSALGINAGSPSPAAGLDSFYGPWTQQVDLGLARRFKINERNEISLQLQVFNLLNHANYYVQNGTGVNAIQYTPFGSNCGDGRTLNQTCFLVPNTGEGGFGTYNVINSLNGPRVMQFALKYSF